MLNDGFINTNFEIFGGDYTFFEAILIVIFTIIHLEKNDLCLIIFSSCDIPGNIQKIVNYQKDKSQRYINICHHSKENWSISQNSIEFGTNSIETISDKNFGFDINWKNIIEFRKFEKKKKE